MEKESAVMDAEETKQGEAPVVESEHDDVDPEEEEQKPDASAEESAGESEESDKSADEDEKRSSDGDEKGESEVSDVNFPEALLTRASQHNLTAEEAREFGTPAQLERALNVTETYYRKAVEATAAVKAPAEPKADVPGDSAIEPLGLNTEGMDEEFGKEMNGVVGRVNEHTTLLRDVRDQLTQIMSTLQSQRAVELEQQMDGLFEGLGDIYHGSFGKGASCGLAAGTPEVLNRNKVIQEMTVLVSGYRQNSLPVPSNRELLERVVRSLFPEVGKSADNKKIQDRLRDQKGQFLPRPSSRGKSPEKPLTGRQNAVNAVKDLMEEQGHTPTEEDEEDYGDF